MQRTIPFGKNQLTPKKGMAVKPIEGHLVPSKALTGWERGMIYSFTESGEMGIQEVVIKGIHNGREFHIIEFSDNIEER